MGPLPPNAIAPFGYPPRHLGSRHRANRSTGPPRKPGSSGPAPQPPGGDRGTFGHCTQFLERDVGVELAVAGERAKAAIAARHDPLAADDIGKAAQTLG